MDSAHVSFPAAENDIETEIISPEDMAQMVVNSHATIPLCSVEIDGTKESALSSDVLLTLKNNTSAFSAVEPLQPFVYLSTYASGVRTEPAPSEESSVPAQGAKHLKRRITRHPSALYHKKPRKAVIGTSNQFSQDSSDKDRERNVASFRSKSQPLLPFAQTPFPTVTLAELLNCLRNPQGLAVAGCGVLPSRISSLKNPQLKLIAIAPKNSHKPLPVKYVEARPGINSHKLPIPADPNQPAFSYVVNDQHVHEENTSGAPEPSVGTEPTDVTPSRKPCNCAVSHCLKLYCDCFNMGELCSNDCSCKGCANNVTREAQRLHAVEAALRRNPSAFQPKVIPLSELQGKMDRSHVKGCKCRKSACLKNYCECFLARTICGELCRCVGCKNPGNDVEDDSATVENIHQPNIGSNNPLSAVMTNLNCSDTAVASSACALDLDSAAPDRHPKRAARKGKTL